MNNPPLSIQSFPRAILHIDGDAFFASCEQARDPKLKGKPVITGKERGIAASMSYEAKAKGVTRGMRLFEIKKICPGAIILPSDYETYSLLSKKFYAIARRLTPDIEEYGIDECFADITGLRRLWHRNYLQLAEKLKTDLKNELGFSFSIGLGPNKVIAKIGSKWKKPSGLTAIPAKDIHLFIENLPTGKIWGIGPQTAAFLQKFKIETALQFARQNENWVKEFMAKPFCEIWQGLNGHFILPLDKKPKKSYASIQKVKTFTPPSNDAEFVFSQLSKNIENACAKARRYNLAAEGIAIFLRTQDFNHFGMEIKFSRPTVFPNEIINLAKKVFDEMFIHGRLYRSTGATLFNLEETNNGQLDLFGAYLKIEKMARLFEAVDKIRSKYGKHTLFLGTSFLAQKFSAHLDERGDEPERKKICSGRNIKKKTEYSNVHGRSKIRRVK